MAWEAALETELVDSEDVPLFERVGVVRRVDLSFDGRADSTEEVPLATGVLSDDWVSAVLVVTLHAKSAWAPASPLLWIVARNVSLSADEPDVVFIGDAVASVRISDGDAPASVQVEALGPSGASLQVIARWTQGAVEGAGPHRATLSVDLVGRRHRIPREIAPPWA